MSVEEAHELRELIKKAFQSLYQGNHHAYSTIGELVLEMERDKKYKLLDYKSLDSFIAGELKQSKATVYAMMNYRKHISPLLGANPGLLKFPVSVICKDFIPPLKKDPSFIERVCELSELSESDRKIELAKLRGKPEFECECTTTENWTKCTECGKFRKV